MDITKHGFSKKADKQLSLERRETEIRKFRATEKISEKELSELEVTYHFFFKLENNYICKESHLPRQEKGKNRDLEPEIREQIVATEPDEIGRLQEEPKKRPFYSGPKQSFPLRNELPDEFGSDPCLSFGDSRQPLLPKDDRTGKQYFLRPALLGKLKDNPRSVFGRSGSSEAIALERFDEFLETVKIN